MVFGTPVCLTPVTWPLMHIDTSFALIEVSFWKLRDEETQEEYGKLAPRVTKEHSFRLAGFESGSRVSSEDEPRIQGAWFIAALEELAQMCGSFLKFASTREAHLDIIVNVGDALNFCDALSAASFSLQEARLGTSLSNAREARATFEPISFQQGTLQPLKLLYDVFWSEDSLEYDVITTSNLAEHLGIVNILVATSPLLKEEPHAVILTSYMATVGTVPLYESVTEFFEQVLCMSSHTAAILLGVVPVPHLSKVVDHADVNFQVVNAFHQELFAKRNQRTNGCPSTMRLTWKHPTKAFAGTVAAPDDVDSHVSISPGDFAKLVLPVYKAMFIHMSTMAILGLMTGPTQWNLVGAMINPNHYTSASFARLVAVAGRRLNLDEAHFEAALDSAITDSGLLLAPNLWQEKVALFQALNLSCIPHFLGGVPGPVDTRRVVLLVPGSGLSLLREFNNTEIFLSLTGTLLPFDTHFATIHMAYVQVHRRHNKGEPDGEDWQSLNKHLSIRETREDDPDAELMVSAVVPTFALTFEPPFLTELQLRPRFDHHVMNASKRVSRKLGPEDWKVFYRAPLGDFNRTAILIPENERVGTGPIAHIPKPIVCPSKGLKYEGQERKVSSTTKLRRGLHGEYAIYYSLELVTEGRSFVYRVSMKMANDEARGLLASIGIHPVVERGHDPCCVHLQLGGDNVRIVSRFPFPVEWEALRLQFSKKRGFLQFTVPPLAGPLEKAFSLTGHSTGEGRSGTVLFSNWCFPASVPLATLPKLDFNVKSTCSKVMGSLSFTPLKNTARQGKKPISTAGVQQGFLELKERFLSIASLVCEKHNESRPFWKHPWICLTETAGSHDGPSLWIWVNNILLDSSNEAVILDCCIMPVGRLEGPASSWLGVGLDTCTTSGSPPVHFVEVKRSELKLWTALLPTAVERARQSYAHPVDCIYSKPNGSGAPSLLCGCGRGKDLPPDFLDCMRSVELMVDGETATPSFFYRAAFSPLYALTGAMPITLTATEDMVIFNGPARCAKCGREGATKLCSRCRSVSYCSKECQRQHWKSHKRVCNRKKALV